jgi:hypothetical protein
VIAQAPPLGPRFPRAARLEGASLGPLADRDLPIGAAATEATLRPLRSIASAAASRLASAASAA